jgi:predicted kinase
VARAGNVPFRGLFLTAGLDVRIARVTARVRDASDATATVARQQESYALGAMAWTEIDASGDLGRTLKTVQDLLASHACGPPPFDEST